MKKILFINPVANVHNASKTILVKPRNLSLLADLTPDKYDVEICDEWFTPLDPDARVDLVAVTCMTPIAPRAYEIAGMFRSRGVPVVLGGIHPSLVPDEAGRHADSVVVGEAEGCWSSLLEDWNAHRLRPRYEGGFATLCEDTVRCKREDLLPHPYTMVPVETTRGCPYDCSFCSVTRFYGRRYRMRPVDRVVAEVASLDMSWFFFIDDNIIGSGQRCRERSVELFDALRGLKKKFLCGACITVADDPKLLKKMYAAGARQVFIGFESIEKDALGMLGKKVNLRHTNDYLSYYKYAVRKIHDQGISVTGGFIVGTDSDDKNIFRKIVDFVFEASIDIDQINILIPLPQTRIYEQFSAQNRLLVKNFPKDWEKYDGSHVVFQPKNMTADELREGRFWAYKATSSMSMSLLRSSKTLGTTKNLKNASVAFMFNNLKRKGAEASILQNPIEK